jgi:hypothetical protein
MGVQTDEDIQIAKSKKDDQYTARQRTEVGLVKFRQTGYWIFNEVRILRLNNNRKMKFVFPL